MRTFALVATLALMVGGTVDAANPKVSQVLAISPVHADFEFDTPSKQSWDHCRLDVLKQPAGWVLYDSRGELVRRFIDSNGDNVVDVWSFYLNGQEVYQDRDTNRNGRPDEHRWYHTAGSRVGADVNEDGKIDQWKVLSAEEAASETVAAIAARDFSRLQRVMLTQEEMRQIGLDDAARKRIQDEQAKSQDKFRALASSMPADTRWMQFDGMRPVAVPASDVGGSQDVVIYQNATIIADANGQSRWLRASEVVKVGDVWKLVGVPTFIEPNRPIDTAGVLVPTHDVSETGEPTNTGPSQMIEDNDEVRKYVELLQKHDASLSGEETDTKTLIGYHVRRAELCAYIGSKSRQMKNREYWYQQTADSINAAVQTGDYMPGLRTLNQYADQFEKTTWGKSLAAYYRYRAINAAYAVELGKPGADHGKAQDAFLDDLKEFLKAHPAADDAPEAFWQLGNGLEFSGKLDDAKAAYRQLVTRYGTSTAGKKAEGALHRLDGEGKTFRLVGNSLGQAGNIDTSKYRGKVVIVSYWATWCEPCKEGMAHLDKLYRTYASKGLEVVGVCLDTDKSDAQSYIRSQGYQWPQIYEEGSMDSGPAVQLGVISLPLTVVIDKQGRIIDRNAQYSQLGRIVEQALAAKVANRP